MAALSVDKLFLRMHLNSSLMKPLFTASFCLILGLPAIGQYYYKDLVAHRNALDLYQGLRKNKVDRVSLTSFEGNGEKTEDFSCEQDMNNGYSQLKTVTKVPISGSSVSINYYNVSTGLIFRSVDSSATAVSVYDYVYDTAGRVAELRNTSGATGEKERVTESHFWSYDAHGKPVSMLRVKDRTDTTLVSFKLDAQGNPIEETSLYKGVEKEKVYYYYDDKNRLTDVVRYNDRLKKLVPDYYFDYDDQGRLVEMVTVQGGGSDRLNWRYEYDERGLKVRERCFDRGKTLLGKIEYQYFFRK